MLHLITFSDTLGRTPLDEGSDRRRGLYLTSHSIHKRHPCPRRDSNPQSHQSSLFRFPAGSLFKTYSTANIYFFHVSSTLRLTNIFEISTFPRICLWKQTILSFAGRSSTWWLTFTFRSLNSNVAAVGRTYLQVKWPHLYLSGTALSFSPINC